MELKIIGNIDKNKLFQNQIIYHLSCQNNTISQEVFNANIKQEIAFKLSKFAKYSFLMNT